MPGPAHAIRRASSCYASDLSSITGGASFRLWQIDVQPQFLEFLNSAAQEVLVYVSEQKYM